MHNHLSPYLPIPSDLASSGLLIPVKQAAGHRACSADTLKNNAKARNLRAFQQFAGAPVLVLLSDVDAFLKARPDITSEFHPKQQVGQCAYGVGGSELPAPWNTVSPRAHPSPPHLPEAALKPLVAVASCDGETYSLRLKSLSSATPAERSLVAQVLLEIFALISRSVPPSPPTQNP